LLALALLLVRLPGWADPPAASAEDEKLLREAGLPSDGAGLLGYFRARALTAGDRERLAALVRDLDDRAFAVREKATRELIAAGDQAAALLRAALRAPSTEEVRRRAARCLQAIEQTPHTARTLAAARLLAVRRPDGAAAALLAYLPSADWHTLGEELLGPLTAVALEGEQQAPVPAVLAAVTDKEPTRRAAVAHVLGRAGREHHKPLAGLLADESPLVRYHAAVALTRARDARGLPALIALLADGPAELAWGAEDLLSLIAGEEAPPFVAGAPEDPAARKRWHAGWLAWWKGTGGKIDLTRAALEDQPLGVTLVAEVDGQGEFPGRVYEVDRAGKVRWTMEGLTSPSDVQRLRSGRFLVAESWAKRVTERDRSGKIVWERKVDSHALMAERLRNGNTLITTYTEILEVTPGGKPVFQYRHTNDGLHCACKLRNGHVLLIDNEAKVIELDAAGKTVLSFKPERYTEGAPYWSTVEPLPGGRYLIGICGTGKVIETDAKGKIHWECAVGSPCYPTRLPNGNTLVASTDGRHVIEVDRAGKEVWRRATKGRASRARRY
jgi:hypothetical protein